MDNVLKSHTPADAVKQRAEVAGIDLEALKTSDPQQYKILNSTPAVVVAAELADMAVSVFLAAFPHYEVFRLESAGRVQLMAFPPLTDKEQLRFDDALARLASHPRYAAQHAFFRTVTDKRGEHRQFLLATPAEAWEGEADVLVGPFDSESAANFWSDAHVMGPALLSDTVLQGGSWFVDVFAGS